MQAQRSQLPAGRWHFQHGPIDLIIGAAGEACALDAAHQAAWERFREVLPELARELAQLRLPVRGPCGLQGPVARRMWQACQPLSEDFITPMAAVAGAVAEELIACYQRPGVARAWVNNGGDIALHLAPAESLRVGLYADLARLDAVQLQQGPTLDGQFSVRADMPVRGIATSGWRGRSFSLGIADSVTVLARTAAQADAAATIIANAVNVADERIERQSASALKDDSDLGDLLVTTLVPALPAALVQQALQAGLAKAQALRSAGLVWSALLTCQNQSLGIPAATSPEARPPLAREPRGLALA